MRTMTCLRTINIFVLHLLLSFGLSSAFNTRRAVISRSGSEIRSTRLYDSDTVFELELDLPPSNSGNKARLKFGSVLSVPSEIVEVRYKIPFGLDVPPLKHLAVCTKDGTGGEQAGDVLRYASQWIMGLPSGDGLAATAAFTGGGPSWQCNMFDVMKAKNWS